MAVSSVQKQLSTTGFIGIFECNYFIQVLHQLPLFLTLVVFSCSTEENRQSTQSENTADQAVKIESDYTSAKAKVSIKLINTIKAKDLALVSSGGTKGANTELNIYKISTYFSGLRKSEDSIPISGVLIIPSNLDLTSESESLRILYTPPFTFTINESAPSVYFSNPFEYIGPIKSIEKHVNQSMIGLAKTSKFAIIMPDYPGYGDSYQIIHHPFLSKDAHNLSNYAILTKGMEVIKALGYDFKKEICLQGYSQGAYSATLFAQYLETNKLQPVRALSVGGTPALFYETLREVVETDRMDFPFFFPHGLFGYTKNQLLDINYEHLLTLNKGYYGLRSFYDFDEMFSYFDGTHSILQLARLFPTKIDLFLEGDFITYLKQSGIEQIPPEKQGDYIALKEVLDYNSLEAWANQCEFRMYHGKEDYGVLLSQAQSFSNLQNQKGEVTFEVLDGNHITAFFGFIKANNQWLLEIEESERL